MRFALSVVALSLAVSATASNPEDLAVARRLFDSGDLDGAGVAARAILEATPDATQARALLGMVRFQQAEAMPQSARSQAVEAYREARKHFEMAEKSMSEVPPHFDVSIGVALSETGETEAAVARFTRAMGKQGVQPIAFWHRANAYLLLDDNAKAAADFAKAIQYVPDDFVLRVRYAETLARLGRARDAIATLDEFYPKIRDQKGDERHRSLLLAKHRYALTIPDINESHAALAEARRTLPNDPTIQIELAVVLYRLENRAEATRELDDLLARADALPPAITSSAAFWRGLIAKHAGDLPLAQRNLERAVELSPLNPAALQNLGAVLLRIGERDRGRQYLKQTAAAKAAVDGIPALQAVVSANPKEAEGYFKLIERLLAVGDHAGAAATLQSLEQSLPDNPSIPTLTHLIGRPGGVPANL